MCNLLRFVCVWACKRSSIPPPPFFSFIAQQNSWEQRNHGQIPQPQGHLRPPAPQASMIVAEIVQQEKVLPNPMSKVSPPCSFLGYVLVDSLQNNDTAIEALIVTRPKEKLKSSLDWKEQRKVCEKVTYKVQNIQKIDKKFYFAEDNQLLKLKNAFFDELLHTPLQFTLDHLWIWS